MKKTVIKEQNVNLTFYVSDENRVALMHCGLGEHKGEAPKKEEWQLLSPVEIATADSGFNSHHGGKKLCGAFSNELRYKDLKDENTDDGRHVRLVLESERGEVVCNYLFINGKHGVSLRVWTDVKVKTACTLEYVSAFRFAGWYPPFNEAAYDRIEIYISHNTWHGEGQWKKGTLSSFGLNGCHSGGVGMKRIVYGNTGSWSSKDYLPAGALSCGNEFMMWHVESNGSWTAEMAQTNMMPYLAISGATFLENSWQKFMQAGDTFSTPYVVMAFGADMNECVAQLTDYKRRYATQYAGDQNCPTQYNGYMHADWDFPTTDGFLSHLAACEKLGIKTFVTDAGWFAREAFWLQLGDWLHPNEPFVGKSFKELIDICHEKGMKAGLWMELEDVGVECPMLPEIDHLLMRRNGVKVRDNNRYFFDFSLPATWEYMDNVVDTVISTYGIDYMKVDYNCDLGVGCDCKEGSFAEGLNKHTKGFADWVRHWHERHPNFVIEGCASGGMRLDQLSLSNFALGNTSDQVCYNRNPYIICNLAAYILPERMGVWSYPLGEQTAAQINMNMVNSMLFRMQLSGEVDKLDEKQLALVKDGVDYFDSITEFKMGATAYLPMGFAQFFDKTVAFGLKGKDKILLAVYNLGGEKNKRIPLPSVTALGVKQTFPFAKDCKCEIVDNALEVTFNEAEESAIFEIQIKE